MFALNSVAILGPRGWVARAVIAELAKTGARIRAVTRLGSRVDDLPGTVEQVEIDWSNPESFAHALSGFDVVLSLVGQAGLADQVRLLPALTASGIKLFVPSDFAYVHDAEDEAKIPVMRNKVILEKALKVHGIPTVTILVGNFAEFALNTPRIGVDMINNRIVHTGQTDVRRINLCSHAYVASVLPSILVSTPIPQLVGRTIGLNEFSPTGAEIEAAMAKKFGKAPTVARATNEQSQRMIEEEHPYALAESVKLKWSKGQHSIGNDIWEVPGMKEVGLEELIVQGQLVKYRPLPFDFVTALDSYFR